jgi:hypothetical protein
MQDTSLADHGRGLRVPLGVALLPGPGQQHLGVGRPAAQNRDVGEHDVAQRALAQALDLGHERGGLGQVPGAEDRVDGPQQPFLAQ